MKKLTENLIQQRLKTCTKDLDKVQQINVTGRDLADVELLRKMTGVEVLSLSVNQISSLVDFQYCKNLKELYLRNNKIANINEIYYLKELPKLELLMLSQNPCTAVPFYRQTVIKNLKNLRELDGIAITQEERKLAQKDGAEISMSDSPIVFEENSIPDGPQIQRTPTQSVQRFTSSGEMQPDMPDSKTFTLVGEKQNKPRETVKEYVRDSAKMPVVSEKHSFKGKPSGLKLKPQISSENNALLAPVCELCGNNGLESLRIIPQNSNILSATLSLIKELDFASLQIINAEVHSLLSAFEMNFICQRKSRFPRNVLNA